MLRAVPRGDDASRIDFTGLAEFAEKEGLSYNELCSVVRAALNGGARVAGGAGGPGSEAGLHVCIYMQTGIRVQYSDDRPLASCAQRADAFRAAVLALVQEFEDGTGICLDADE